MSDKRITKMLSELNSEEMREIFNDIKKVDAEPTEIPKTIFDKYYLVYRNADNLPRVPLEAREMIFNCMKEYGQYILNKNKK